MRPSRRPIIIATRRSRLARAQSEAIAERLRRLHPRVTVELLPIESEGDQVADRSLAEVGGKGLFTSTIEQALLDGRADVAIHSMKDLPADPTPGLVMAAIPARADPRDALVSPDTARIEDLPDGATVGTSSPRRAAQLLRLRSDLRIELLRGNVDTRIRRIIEERRFSATVMAMAGLIRADLAQHADKPIDIEQMLPAPAQGALAVQCRADDHVSLRRCLPLNHPGTSTAVNAEREIVSRLRADCHTPLAVYAFGQGDGQLGLWARVLSRDGSQCLESRHSADAGDVRDLCGKVMKELKSQGVEQLLAAERGRGTPTASG